MYKEFLATAVLNDGTTSGYAKGITVQEKNGHRMLEHAGGINGFLSENRYFPDDDLKHCGIDKFYGPRVTQYNC